MNRNRARLIALGTIVVIIGLVLAMSSLLHPGVSIVRADVVPSNLATAAAFLPDSLVYSSDQQLLTYSYTDGTSKAISPIGPSSGLSGNDSLSVSADHAYVLFHNGQAVPGGLLSQQLAKQHLDPSQDYWWLYTVSTQQFYALPAGTLLARLGNGTVYTLSRINNSSLITSYDVHSLTPKSSTQTVASSDFLATSSGFVLQSITGQLLFTQNGETSRVLANKATLVGVTADQTVMASVTSPSDTALEAINLATGSKKVIAHHVSGAAAWLASGSVLYQTNSGPLNSNVLPSFFVYDAVAKKNMVWHIHSGLLNTNNVSYNVVALLSSHAAVISDNLGNYYLCGDQTLHVTKLSE
ncbi:MAG TPA: hypothetical protein VLF91_01850 [Candidatus Saccharimonadales bacterium]|nr:hypothetical protein [Candidatus Saccharimonadales bacterium]